MRIYGEESFGPVVAILTVDGIDEAVRVANDTDYGLVRRGVRRGRRDRAGRRPADRERHLPRQRLDRPRRAADALRRRQGERLGRFGGGAALEEFTELRWMTVQQGARHYPI